MLLNSPQRSSVWSSYSESAHDIHRHVDWVEQIQKTEEIGRVQQPTKYEISYDDMHNPLVLRQDRISLSLATLKAGSRKRPMRGRKPAPLASHVGEPVLLATATTFSPLPQEHSILCSSSCTALDRDIDV
ncbi:hypothetical protein KPH14_006623 [Odynerus spinipes]|uniref:Uncharacterized protein n=1 Tax=Odynerus spinipes TaxID=1348599 RepID=A0AAD9RQT8_9HYME|nr:hypothetical protein KPH14_006623 [Odynerus spinipes]